MARRYSPPQPPEEALRWFLENVGSPEMLEPLLELLPPGSTIEDARRARERVMQLGRRPCSFLDGPLGIKRD